MSTPVLTKTEPDKSPTVKVAEKHDILPTLFGEGQGLYPQRKDTFVYSFILHMIAVALIIWSGHWLYSHKDEIKQQVIGLVTDISPYLPLPVSKTGWRRRWRRRSRQVGSSQGRTAQALQRSDRASGDRRSQ